MNDLKLKKYLARLGLRTAFNNDLVALKTLHQLHPKNFTFENIDLFTGGIPALDPDAIFSKLVEDWNGGRCYEQNLLFRDVLQTLNFEVKMHTARVLWCNKDGKARARAHLLLSTTIKGEKYLVDVGFGSMTLTAPLLLNTDITQKTPNGLFRLVIVDTLYQLEVFKNDWLPIYKFAMEEVELPDLEMANWYSATHPDAAFSKFLMISRVDERARYSLFNHIFTIRYNNGGKESLVINDPDQLDSILCTYLNLNLPIMLTDKIYARLSGFGAACSTIH